MADTVDAIVTRSRGINYREQHIPDGTVLFGMPVNQFEDWRLIGFVDRATPEQVAAAKDAAEKAEAARARKAAAKAAKPKADKTA